MNPVKNSIKHSIQKNGFPEKKVALPFQPIFDSCKKNGLKLAEVLKNLEKEGIYHHVGQDRITFSPQREMPHEKGSSDGEESLREGYLKTAMEQLKKIDPRQLNALKEKVMNLTPEERQELLNRAKDLFSKKSHNSD